MKTLGVAVAVCILLFSVREATATLPPEVGGQLPDFSLSTPEDAAARDYLGLSGQGGFKIPQIKAELVIVEVMNTYCATCQREALHMNQLYQAIGKRDDLRNRVKIIGIAAGNSVFEISVFRDAFKTPFPVFPDDDFSIHKLLGEVRTPYFIGIRIKSDGSHEVIYSKLGAFKDPNVFLKTLLDSSGIQ